MSLDAQDWVWEHSQAKGTARLVLLAIADKAQGKDVSAYAGSAFLMRRANASKSAIKTALDVLRESGELRVVTGRKGPQGETRYRLPKAAGHRRSGSESPQFEGGSDPVPPGQIQEPQGGTGIKPRGGTESDPGGIGFEPRGGTESDPRNAVHTSHGFEGTNVGAAADDSNPIPDWARPLVDTITASGVIVRWPYTSNEWLIVHVLIKRSGVAAMAEYARNTAARTRVDSARYFIPGWKQLPPLPEQGSENVVQLRPAAGGYQPWRNPTDDSVYDQPF